MIPLGILGSARRASSGSVVFADDFNRTTFATGWSVITGGFAITSGVVNGTAGGAYNIARTTAATPANDGYAQVQITVAASRRSDRTRRSMRRSSPIARRWRPATPPRRRAPPA